MNRYYIDADMLRRFNACDYWRNRWVRQFGEEPVEINEANALRFIQAGYPAGWAASKLWMIAPLGSKLESRGSELENRIAAATENGDEQLLARLLNEVGDLWQQAKTKRWYASRMRDKGYRLPRGTS